MRTDGVQQQEWRAEYEPELFPALQLRQRQGRATTTTTSKIMANIFATGKFVITGGKTEKEIDDYFKKIYPILKSVEKYNK